MSTVFSKLKNQGCIKETLVVINLSVNFLLMKLLFVGLWVVHLRVFANEFVIGTQTLSLMGQFHSGGTYSELVA